MAKQSFPPEWGLTPLEAAYLRALRPGRIVSADALAALHAGPLANPAARVGKVMRQLRGKLDPYNIEIATHWGKGWQLKQRARMRLTSLVRAA